MTGKIRGERIYRDFRRAVENERLNMTDGEFVKFFRQISRSALRKTIKRTPRDTGLLRGNWQLTINSPAARALKRRDRAGDYTYRVNAARLKKLKIGDVVFISNLHRAANIVERGKFVPRNPGPSSDPRPGRKGRILVRGGYSVQAPRGMLSITYLELLTGLTGAPEEDYL